MNMQMTIQKLVARRLAAGLTQSDVAKLMGVSQARVAEFESGRHEPFLSTLQRYAKVVNSKVGIEVEE